VQLSVRCRTYMSCRADHINSLVAESLQPPIAHTLRYNGRQRTPATCTDTSDRQSPGQVAPMSGDRSRQRPPPHLCGGGFDLPIIGPVLDEYVASHGLQDRPRFDPGDFFEGIPALQWTCS
jgi:hypothetical protein